MSEQSAEGTAQTEQPTDTTPEQQAMLDSIAQNTGATSITFADPDTGEVTSHFDLTAPQPEQDENRVHVHKADIRPLYQLVEALADSDAGDTVAMQSLITAAVGMVTAIQASQYDRDALSWTLTAGDRHFRDPNGNIVPNRAVRRAESDEAAYAHLSAQRAAAYGYDSEDDSEDDSDSYDSEDEI